MTDCVHDDRYSLYPFRVILELNTHRRLYRLFCNLLDVRANTAALSVCIAAYPVGFVATR